MIPIIYKSEQQIKNQILLVSAKINPQRTQTSLEDYMCHNNPKWSKQNISEESSFTHDFEPSQKTTLNSVTK